MACQGKGGLTTPRPTRGRRMCLQMSPRGQEAEIGGNLNAISERLIARSQARIGLVGRCHSAPNRTLEQDYELTSTVLGTGYNGSVRLATPRHGNVNRRVAVKTLSLKGLTGRKKLRLQSEIEVYLCMDHPHVARLVDVYETDHHMNIVMECAAGGELFNRVKRLKAFSEVDAAGTMKQILLAVHYLHTHGMVHRDLKLENFLYDTEDGSHLKMIDFGFSKYTSRETRMRTSCGTLAYVAPEVLNGSYTSQCDLWSVGVIAFVLLSGCMPFDTTGTSEEQMEEIKRGGFLFKPKYWSAVSQTAKDFVRSLLDTNPARRLDSKRSLTHKWITESCVNKVKSIDMSVISALSSWSSAPKLRKAYMSMMAWTLTNEQHAIFRDSFFALDVDQDGVISIPELTGVMTGTLSMPEEEVSQIVASLGGAEIKYSDFLAAMTLSNQISLDDDLLQSTFTKFDTGGSGYITTGDLRAVLGSTYEGKDVEALVNEGDNNKDGKIDFEEFANCARSYHPGTLLRKAGTSGAAPAENPPVVPAHDEKQVAHDARAVRHVQLSHHGQQACCVLQ